MAMSAPGTAYDVLQPQIIDYAFSNTSYSFGGNYQLNKDLPVYKAGERYVGVVNDTKPRDKTQPWGYWGSVLPMTGKSSWRTPLIDLPSWSGAMVTAGGLVFTGNTMGDFAALARGQGHNFVARADDAGADAAHEAAVIVQIRVG